MKIKVTFKDGDKRTYDADSAEITSKELYFTDNKGRWILRMKYIRKVTIKNENI